MKPILVQLAFFLLPFFLQAQTNNYESIKGTWITNVASDAMHTPEKVKETVAHCKRNGLTDIFVVVWNNGVTMYPSKVVKAYIGIEQSTVYKNFDPLKAFVEEGHKLGLRVHAWFEFGFAYAYQDSSNKKWLEKYPHWAGRKQNGHLLQKNKFFWWNALHPEVQTFMNKLVIEVVNNYGVDGVQGDDRLPAMPGEGGYDSYSVELYKKENNGVTPPTDYKDSAWIQWKANKLSEYGKNLYQLVKKARSNCLVTWAPSIYPWSKEQYLQDWPAWLKGGYADFILPQLYRYDLVAYEKILKELSTQVPSSMKHKLFPGILTSLGDGYRVKPDMLQKMIELNRQYGFKGEVCFYYETIKETTKPLY
jgi:uncharacterized lipoprotein YddW (UPF0748 family)